MTIIAVTDNYYFKEGLSDVIDYAFYIESIADFRALYLRECHHALDENDYVIIHLSNLAEMMEVYSYYRLQGSAEVMVALDIKLVSAINSINDVFFLSSDADVLSVNRFFKNDKRLVRRRVLTLMEERVISLMLVCQAVNEVATNLKLSDKTISIHKNRIRNKVGLVRANNINLYSLIRFISPGNENGVIARQHV